MAGSPVRVVTATLREPVHYSPPSPSRPASIRSTALAISWQRTSQCEKTWRGGVSASQRTVQGKTSCEDADSAAAGQGPTDSTGEGEELNAVFAGALVLNGIGFSSRMT
eukprot:6193111-Pleurochrysis_carterae.AAC.1